MFIPEVSSIERQVADLNNAPRNRSNGLSSGVKRESSSVPSMRRVGPKIYAVTRNHGYTGTGVGCTGTIGPARGGVAKGSRSELSKFAAISCEKVRYNRCKPSALSAVSNKQLVPWRMSTMNKKYKSARRSKHLSPSPYSRDVTLSRSLQH